jgi:hypothetical protein
MLKNNYAEKINMDNYQFYLWQGFNVSSPMNKTFHHVYSLGDSSDSKVETMICALLDMASPMFFVCVAV